MAQDLTLRFRVTDEGTILLDKISQKIGAIDESAKKMSSSLSLIKFEALVNLGQQAIRAAQQFGEFMKVGAKAIQVENSFKMITQASGIMGDKLIQDMKRASGVFVEETEIMIKAQRLLLEGMGTEDIVKLTEVARLMARVMGIDVSDAFDTLTESIITMRTRGLAPAFPTIKEADELFKKFAESNNLVTDELNQTGKRMILVQEIFRVFDERLKAHGPLVEDASEKIQKYRSAWSELYEGVSKAAVNTGYVLHDFGTTLGIEIADQQNKLDKYYLWLQEHSPFGEKQTAAKMVGVGAAAVTPAAIGEWPSETRYIDYKVRIIEDEEVENKIVDTAKRLENAFKELGLTASDDLEKKIKRAFENINLVLKSGKKSVEDIAISYKSLFDLLSKLQPPDMAKKLSENWQTASKSIVDAEVKYQQAAKALQEQMPERGPEYSRAMEKLGEDTIATQKKIREEMEKTEKGIRMTLDVDYAKEQVQKLIEELKAKGVKVPIEFEPPTKEKIEIIMNGVLYTYDEIKDKIKSDPVIPQVDGSKAEIEMDGVLYKYNELKDKIEKTPIKIKTEGGTIGGGGGSGVNIWGIPAADFFKGEGVEGNASLNIWGIGSSKKPITEKIQEIIGEFGGLEKAMSGMEAEINLAELTSEYNTLQKKLAQVERILPDLSNIASASGGSPYVGGPIVETIKDLTAQYTEQMKILQMKMNYEAFKAYAGEAQTGVGYVPRTAFYKVHEGERILRKNVSVGDIHIHLEGGQDPVRAVVKALKFRLSGELEKALS